MEIQNISLDQIRTKESKYRFCQIIEWDPEDRELKPLLNAVKKLGILQPLSIHRAGDAFHLVDGFKRAVLAPILGIKILPCYYLPEGTPPQEILELLLIEHRHKICSTLASKIRFITFALQLDLKKDILVQSFFPLLDIKGHEAVLEKVEAIARLPEEVLDFCDKKNFSMRQCTQLTRFTRDLLLQVLSWKSELSLSASIIEEILSNLNDYLKRSGQNLSGFFCDNEVKDLFASSMSSHERTEQLRALIKKRRYPILTDTNRKLKQICEQMSLPKNVDLHWDPTLERRELQLILKILEPSEWEGMIQALRDDKITQGIHRLLEDL